MLQLANYNLRHEFTRQSMAYRHHQQRLREKLEREQQRLEEQAAEDDLMSIAQMAVEVTAEDIAAFDDKLTIYETLTTAEIMRLQEQMDQLLEQREVLLSNAYVLPNGRRVFKTEDGTQVFDENGTEVSTEIVSPEQIEDWRPRWETYNGVTQDLEQTKSALNELHKFQSELDEIREDFNGGKVSAEELADLEKRLEASVPETIRMQKTAMDAKGPLAARGQG